MAEIRRVLCASRRDRRFACRRTRRERLLFWSGRKAAFPGDRPHHARLLLHGRHDSAQRAAAGAGAHRGAVRAVRAALRQRVSRRRRQPASADPVRRQRRRRDRRAPRRSAPRSSSCASRSAARSPASTASASRSCRRCACSSAPGELERFLAHQGGVRPARTAQSRQGRAHAASLRRIRQDARPSRQPAASGHPALLRRSTMTLDDRSTTSRLARPDAARRSPISSPALRRLRRARGDHARDPRPAQPRRRTRRCRAARRRRVPAHQRRGRGDRAALPRGARARDRVRRGHVARRSRRRARTAACASTCRR